MPTPENPSPAKKPDPISSKPPEKPEFVPAPEKKVGRPRKADKDGAFSMIRQNRKDGFGLYICGNCKWHNKARPPREKSCKESNIPECAIPCNIYKKFHGHFEPNRLGQAAVKKLDISHLDAGELMILAYRCRKAVVEKVKRTLRNFRIGDKVKFYLNDELCFGEVARITRRYVIIEPDHGGGDVTLKPVDVELDEDPPAQGQ
jgi:hypothetical protein